MGDPVLTFLHPIGLDARSAGWVARPWGHTPDLLGHGGRPWPQAGASLDDLADDIAARAPGRMHIVGALLGGAVGLHLALRHPNRVASLMVVASSTHTDAARLVVQAQQVATGDRRVESTLARWFSAATLAVRPAPSTVEYARGCLNAIPLASLAGCWQALAAHDVRAHVAELCIPVTVVAGSRDVVHPAGQLRADAGMFPDGRFEVVESTHMVPLDNPAALAAAIDRHLAAYVRRKCPHQPHSATDDP